MLRNRECSFDDVTSLDGASQGVLDLSDQTVVWNKAHALLTLVAFLIAIGMLDEFRSILVFLVDDHLGNLGDCSLVVGPTGCYPVRYGTRLGTRPLL